MGGFLMKAKQLGWVRIVTVAMLAPFALAACSRTPVDNRISLRPGCAAPTVSMVTASEDLTVKAGTKVTIVVTVADKDGSHMVSGTLVVAKPGSIAAAGDPAGLPTNAAALPPNQLGTATLEQAVGKRVAELSYDTQATGDYPIVFVGVYQATGDCSAGSPLLPNAIYYAAPLGHLRVD
jgi:hypothetical protein